MKKIIAVFCLLVVSSTLATAVTADKSTEENNYLKIERTSTELKSRLDQMYTGHEYVIQNISDTPVKIHSVALWNDANGKVAYLSTKKTTKEARKEAWAKSKSIAIPTLGLSYLGTTVSLPFISLKNSTADKSAKNEAEKFNKQNLQNITVKPNNSIKFRTLAIKKHTPLMRIIFVNPVTDENMTMELTK